MYNTNKKFKRLLGLDIALGLAIYLALTFFNASMLGPLNEIVMTPSEGAFIFTITLVVLSTLYSAILQLTRLVINRKEKERVYEVRKASFKDAIADIPKFTGRLIIIAIAVEFVSPLMRALLLLPTFISVYYDRLLLAKQAFIDKKFDEKVDTIDV